MKKFLVAALFFSMLAAAGGCSSKKSVKFVRQGMPKGSSIGVIVDSQNNVKNVILSRFLEKGFKVKAVNASDLYTLNDHFSIADFTRLAYESGESPFGQDQESLSTVQKSYDNIYKLHVYSYEANKAEILSEMRSKWGLRYIVILDLKDWESTSWMRVIDLESYDIVAIENYPTRYSDGIESVIDHFIETVSAQAQ